MPKSTRLPRVVKVAAYRTVDGSLFERLHDAAPAQMIARAKSLKKRAKKFALRKAALEAAAKVVVSKISQERADKRLIKSAKSLGLNGERLIDFINANRKDVILALAQTK